MATFDLGRVTPLHKGDYSASTSYELNDVVLYNGSLYWHVQATATVGILPTDTTVWKLAFSDEGVRAEIRGYADDAQVSADSALSSKTAAAQSASQASASASQAALSAQSAHSAETGATASAQTASSKASEASASAQSAASSAQTATDKATLASQKAAAASESASLATAKANAAATSETNAAASAQTASAKASEAAASATSAQEYDESAQQSAVNAQTAQGLAETAQTAAETAQGLAEDARDDAQEIVDGINAKSEQIDTLDTRVTGVVDAINEVKADLANSVNDLNSALNEVRDIVEPENYCDMASIVTGAVAGDGTIDTSGANANYRTSDYIPVESGQTYKFCTFSQSTDEVTTERKIYNIYDSTKTVIQYGYVNQNGESALTITPASGTAFIRISAYKNQNMSLTKGDTAPEHYSEYFAPYPEISAKLGLVPLTQIEDIIPPDVAEVVYSKNLADMQNMTTGYIQQDGLISTEGGYNSYTTSDYIPVKASADYCFSTFKSSDKLPIAYRKGVLFYNSEKAVVSGSYINDSRSYDVTFTTTATTTFVRIASYNSTVFDLEEDVTHIESYTPYADPYVSLKILLGSDPINQIKETLGVDVLYGKKWVPIGDSFTNYTNKSFSDGKYGGQNCTYPRIIASRRNMEIVQKFFRDGRTLAFPATPGDFVNSITCPTAEYYYQNIPEDADYITFYIGINDEHHYTGGGDGEDPTGLITLGTIDDNTTATYYGAWNVVLSWLIANRPNAHIGIIVTNGLSIADWRTAQIDIAKKYGIAYIDMNGDERTPVMLRTVNPDIPNAVKSALITKWAVDPEAEGGSVNTHPNWQAHEYEATFIENFLRSI